MKKIAKVLVLSMMSTVLVIGLAFADNVRPFIPPTGDLSPLQAVFTGIGSNINVNTDQLSAAYFVPTGAGGASAAFIAQITWAQSQELNSGIEFGLYQLGNPSNNVTVIPAFSTPLLSATIFFNFVTGTITTSYADGSGVIDTANFANSAFGFYTFTNYNGTGFLYSDDSLNPSGSAQQLIYEGKGDMVRLPWPNPVTPPLSDIAHYYVGAEGLAINGATTGFSEGSFDFNDMVMQLESVAPVPEPATMLLLGSGLLGLGVYARRRFSKK